ncbi:hypothetical protein [Pseudorhodoplanes sp.]|uniref:hypothetical protein n=1 Tax=Pseudorhodoplanes sp. TaxID=1934341 RepID=UPI003D0B9A0D
MKRLLILTATILVCASLFASASIARTIQCAAEVPAAPKGHWYYRLIEGRKCWYQGKPMMPKSALQWPKSNVAEAEATQPVDEVEAKQATTDGRGGGGQPAPEPAAAHTRKPEVWPTPVVDDGSFESRWRGLQSGS